MKNTKMSDEFHRELVSLGLSATVRRSKASKAKRLRTFRKKNNAKKAVRSTTPSVRNGLYVTGHAPAQIVDGGLPGLGKRGK